MNHKRISKISIILTLVLLIILVSVVPASAQAARIDYTSTTCILSQSAPERFWISDDGIMHSRGIIANELLESENGYGTGTAIMTMNVDIDLATGYGHAFGTFLTYPTGYDGSWEGNWSSHISPEGLRGIAVGHGTGELEGMQFINNLWSDNPNDPCTNGNVSVLIP